VEKNFRYWRVNVGHYGEEMLGTKENKSLLELSQRPKYHLHFFKNIFHPFSWVRGTYRKIIIFDSGSPLRGKEAKQLSRTIHQGMEIVSDEFWPLGFNQTNYIQPCFNIPLPHHWSFIPMHKP
jgi:hypothetical protein